MIDVMQLNRDQFIAVLAAEETPTRVYRNAGRIYDFLSDLFGQRCMDSLLREWAFQWATEQLGYDYSMIYDKWLNESE